MPEPTWQDRLAVGDPVVVITDHGARRRLWRVARLTKTKVFVRVGPTEMAFNRRTGREVGAGTYYGGDIIEATPDIVDELIEEAHRRVLLRTIDGADWKALPTATLAAVAALVTTTEAADDGE